MTRILYILLLFPFLLQAQYQLKPDVKPMFRVLYENLISPTPVDTTNNYYVDNTGTGDTLSTIAEVNALTLEPGDTVFFKKGAEWREQLDVPNHGTANLYVVFTT